MGRGARVQGPRRSANPSIRATRTTCRSSRWEGQFGGEDREWDASTFPENTSSEEDSSSEDEASSPPKGRYL